MWRTKISRWCCLLVTAGFLIASCATLPATPTAEFPATPAMLETSAPTATPLTPTDTPEPGLSLSQVDEVVFTIPNEQPFSGREGEPRPDWLGWGAETFTVAPDGSFWIADTAVRPQRLLHFSDQGEHLKQISLENQVVGLYDLVVSKDALWILDIASQPARVLRLNLDGELLSSAGIPEALMISDGGLVSNGIFNIWLGEKGELLISGVNGLHELIDPVGEITANPVETLAYNGHTYQTIPDLAEHTLSITVDGEPVEILPPDFVEGEPFLGFNPDGSFPVSMFRETPVAGDVPSAIIEWLVHYYTPSGELLGIARRWPRALWSEFSHDLALGPDGMVYQLVSNPDHSVQVVRLGFTPELLPAAQVEPAATPTPLTPPRPAQEQIPQDGDQALAREALLSFFTYLSEGRYAEAAALYGGNYEEIPFGSPVESGEDLGAYWQRVCQGVLCLPVSGTIQTEQVAEEEMIFYIEFVMEDGTRFELGACCGANPAEFPPVWQFRYPVKKVAGAWKVMRGPLFMP